MTANNQIINDITTSHDRWTVLLRVPFSSQAAQLRHCMRRRVAYCSGLRTVSRSFSHCPIQPGYNQAINHVHSYNSTCLLKVLLHFTAINHYQQNHFYIEEFPRQVQLIASVIEIKPYQLRTNHHCWVKVINYLSWRWLHFETVYDQEWQHPSQSITTHRQYWVSQTCWAH